VRAERHRSGGFIQSASVVLGQLIDPSMHTARHSTVRGQQHRIRQPPHLGQ
jgi:hypothetical protein